MSCLLEVDGQPDVVTCRTPLRPDMDVRSQLTSPSLSSRVRRRATHLAERALSPQWFTRPEWLRERWMRFLGRRGGRAGLDLVNRPSSPLPFEELAAQVLIVGAGTAGLACANEANTAGLQVLLVDRGRKAGGWWARWEALGGPPHNMEPLRSPPPGLPLGVRFLGETTVIGLYEDRTALAIASSRAFRIRFESVVVANGCYPRLLAFPGSDGPMCIPVQGIVRTAVENGWVPASAVLLDADGRGAAWGDLLRQLGVSVSLVALSPGPVVRRDIAVAENSQGCRVRLATGRHLRCEAVCWSAGWRPRTELVRQLGGAVEYTARTDAFVPALQDGAFLGEHALAAGGCAGVRGFASSQLHGRLAGAALAATLRPGAAQGRYQALAADWAAIEPDRCKPDCAPELDGESRIG
jgi:glycine/D-amino acid oxidase-like deaminating enzyme